jgi:hypothetical protein
MNDTRLYNGSLAAEQFLFYEIRIVAPLRLDKVALDDAIEKIKRDNLFQYPTERQVARMTRACWKRIDALDNDALVYELANASNAVAKQINLYAVMRQNRLVWDVMTRLIGEKYRRLDFSYSRRDLNVFFSNIQVENAQVASWSEKTVEKIKGVLGRMLVETGYLDTPRSAALNRFLLCRELEEGVRANGDLDALPAFNCFN